MAQNGEIRELTKQIAAQLAVGRYFQLCTDFDTEFEYNPFDASNQASPRSIGQRCAGIAQAMAAGILEELSDE